MANDTAVPVRALKSTANSARDTWTVRDSPIMTLEDENAYYLGQLVGGGGEQHFIPNARYLIFTSRTLEIVGIGSEMARINPRLY